MTLMKNQTASILLSSSNAMILLSIMFLTFSESGSSAAAFTVNASSKSPFVSKTGRTDRLYVGRNGQSFEQRDRFNYEFDFADRIGGTPNPDSWSQPVNGSLAQRRRRGVPARPTARTTHGKNEGGAPDTGHRSKPVNRNNNGRQPQRNAPVPWKKSSVKRGTVNGANNYETDFADRIGSSPVSRNNGRQPQRNAPVPWKKSSVKRGTVNGANNYETDFADRIGSSPVSRNNGRQPLRNAPAPWKKSSVNGANNYETDFADRIGSSPDVDNWSMPVNGNYGRRRGRVVASPEESTVNGMWNYETDFADRIGSSPDVDNWSMPVNGNYGRRRGRVVASPEESTVNGMWNYDTDFADRIGSSPDVDNWSRPAVNGLKIRRRK